MFMYCSTKTLLLNTMYSGEVGEIDRSYGLLQRWHRDVISGGGWVGMWGVRVVMSGIKKGDREHAELRLAITRWGDLKMEAYTHMQCTCTCTYIHDCHHQFSLLSSLQYIQSFIA